MRITTIINSVSKPTKHAEIISALRSALRQHELQIRFTEYPGHATELSRKAVEEGVDIIVIAGGDGTINQALNGIMGADIRLGIIPIGAANDLANHFGIPKSAVQACEVIPAGNTQRIDALRINNRYFLTTAGFGIGCDTIARVQGIRSWSVAGRRLAGYTGHRLYGIGYAMATVRKKDWPCRMSVRRNGLDISCNALSLTISNLPRLGDSFIMAPDAHPLDGYFNICLIESHTRAGAFRAAAKARSGRVMDAPGVKHWRARSAIIQCQEPVPFFADGELLPPASHFDLSIVPGAVSLITPAATEVN